jgi:hypothetical protein
MDAPSAFGSRSTFSLTRQELLSGGVSARAIASAVRAGAVIRARRGVYCPVTAPVHVIRALRVGGLAACTSAAESLGLWVAEQRHTEVWLSRNASRLRSPDHPRIPLTQAGRFALRTHWAPLLDDAAATSWRMGVLDAVAQCLVCVPRAFALAVRDSALHTAEIG